MTHRQRGLSLIELMIALVISSFLILGVTQLYISNKQNYLFQQGQAINQENGRYSLLMLEQQLSKAGFRRRPFVDVTAEFPAKDYKFCKFAAGETINTPDSQTLCIRYKPRDTVELDCLGYGASDSANLKIPYTSTAAEFVERYTLTKNADEDLPGLTCQTPKGIGTLIDGVADVRFDFGASTTARKVSSYSDKPAAGQQIGAVRYRLLLASSKNLDTGVNPIIASWNDRYKTDFKNGDSRIYQIAGSTISLRNLMP